MDATYTMIGGDGLQYGPITLDQLKSWVSEGRVTSTTKILRSDTNSWLPAADYAELGFTTTLPSAPPPVVVATASSTSTPAPVQGNVSAFNQADAILARRVNSGARWFFWIAALSLINTISVFAGKPVFFVIGLAASIKIQELGANMDNANVTLVLNILITGLFALLGFFAMRRQSWSFIVGLVLYAGDTVLLLTLSMSALGIVFHALVLFWMFMGLKANMDLKSRGY